MESLGYLTPECISLLHKNNLLKPLIQAEVKNDILSQVVIEKSIEESTIQSVLKSAGVNEEKDFDNFLKANKISKDEFKNKALFNIKLKKYCKDNFSNKVESHFLTRKSKLDIVIYSLIRVQDMNKAKEIFLRIQDEKISFGDLASKYSEGAEKKTRGIVGPALLEKTHPTLAELIRRSQPGKVVPPIIIDDCYLIFRLESYEPAKLDEFMREKMAEELFNTWINSKVNDINLKYLSQNSVNKSSLEVL